MAKFEDGRDDGDGNQVQSVTWEIVPGVHTETQEEVSEMKHGGSAEQWSASNTEKSVRNLERGG